MYIFNNKILHLDYFDCTLNIISIILLKNLFKNRSPFIYWTDKYYKFNKSMLKLNIPIYKKLKLQLQRI